jgi:hypothetical protein
LLENQVGMRSQATGTIADDCARSRHPRGTYQNLPGTFAHGAAQCTAPYGFGGPGQGMALAYTRWLERHNQNREKMATLAVTQRRHTQHNLARLFLRRAADARGLPELANGGVPP